MVLFLYSGSRASVVCECLGRFGAPLRATMFHAVGLKVMARTEMYKDVAEMSTREENASMLAVISCKKANIRRTHVFPTTHEDVADYGRCSRSNRSQDEHIHNFI